MKTWITGCFIVLSVAGVWRYVGARGSSSEFPEGFDAVQAAPRSHKIIFENSLVRVLEVRIPAAGSTEPMHHHRWPGFFVDWDTGGRSPHIRYRTPDGKVRDIASRDEPAHAGRWQVHWMEPEPIEVVERYGADPSGEPPELRVEIKTRR